MRQPEPVTIPYSSGDFFGHDDPGTRPPCREVTIPYSSGDFFGLNASGQEWIAVIIRVTIPYSSGDFFGPGYAYPYRMRVFVTIPYSSGDFFGPHSGNDRNTSRSIRNDPLLIG